MVLRKNFFEKNTLQVAQNLLGCFLVRKYRGKIIRGLITETEGYLGEEDLASHASKGRTKRTELMYGEAGKAYVYIIYGMYYCLNIVTEEKDYPSAVLIRGIEIEGLDSKKTNGPGKVCREMKIDRKFNGFDVTKGEKLWIEPRQKNLNFKVKKDKRIGVDYAGECKDYLWRFMIDRNCRKDYKYKLV